MASQLPSSSCKPLLLTIMAIGFLLPVAYFGSYYANLAERRYYWMLNCGYQPAFPLQADGQQAPKYLHCYRICQNQSEVIFWPAEQVDAVVRP